MSNNKSLRELMRETLNENLIRDLKIDQQGIERLTDLYTDKHLLLQKARKLAVEEKYVEIRKLAKDLTEIEYELQETYGFERNLSWHRFWEIPSCSCPVFDNILQYPSDNYWVNSRCPIHGPKKK